MATRGGSRAPRSQRGEQVARAGVEALDRSRDSRQVDVGCPGFDTLKQANRHLGSVGKFLLRQPGTLTKPSRIVSEPALQFIVRCRLVLRGSFRAPGLLRHQRTVSAASSMHHEASFVPW